MRMRKRLQLLIGILIVLAFGVFLLDHLTYTMSRVSSSSAKLQADTYSIGTEYSGTVVQQLVDVGSHVTAGQKLFVIQSSVLISDIAAQHVSTESLGFSVDKDNNIILTAKGDGTVSSISYLQGSFVPANKEVGSIATANSMYVEATYHLAPSDYARIQNGNLVEVVLPNNKKVAAHVFLVATRSSNNTVETVVRARVQNPGTLQTTFGVGTPVTAVLHLTGKTLRQNMQDIGDRLFKPHG
jgi:multidrug resistance efflux pump